MGLKICAAGAALFVLALLSGCGGGGGGQAYAPQAPSNINLRVELPRTAENGAYSSDITAVISVLAFDADGDSTIVANATATLKWDESTEKHKGAFFISQIPPGTNYICHVHAYSPEVPRTAGNGYYYIDKYLGSLADISYGVTSDVLITPTSTIKALTALYYALWKETALTNTPIVNSTVKSLISDSVDDKLETGDIYDYMFTEAYYTHGDPFDPDIWTQSMKSVLQEIIYHAGLPHPVCGNGTIEFGEQCDDGNTAGGDGCSASCTTETLATNAWITIPAGDFVMGCATGDSQCDSDESPKHTVYLSEYKIQKYEVTNAQYKACVDAGACTAPSDFSSYTRSSYYGNATYDNYPVIYVDWHQASAYCAWIGGRLPTEAEWEKAARGPSPREVIYPWGNDTPTCSLVNGYVSGDCVGDTSEVGSYPAGASYYGVMDLAGNVWEWVNDWYDDAYYATSPSTDPQGPVSSPYGFRVLRGGSWNYLIYSSYLRASFRNNNFPSHSNYYIGFRCAQD